MTDDLKQRVEAALILAKSAGAQDAWVSVSRSREVETQWRDGSLEKVQDATSLSMSIRLYVDGRYSSNATTDLRPASLDGFLKEAVALTRALQPDPFRSLPDPSQYATNILDLQLFDSTLHALTPEIRQAKCAEAEAAAHQHADVISATAGWSDANFQVVAGSTNGFSGSYRGTVSWLVATTTVRDVGDRRPEGDFWAADRFISRLPSPTVIGQQALENALRRRGAKKIDSRMTTLVVDPRAGASLLGRLLGPATAASVQQGRSFWTGNVGKTMVSPKLTVIDNPFILGGLASRPFDDEGLVPRHLPLIESGQFSNLYVDTYYGKKAGLQSTTGSPSNRTVSLGNRSLSQMIPDLTEGILVTSWLGGNSDATSGDFSLGVRGFHIQNGQIAEPISEMNVTGNLLTLFRQLIEVGNDPWTYASTLTPTLVFEGVQFSGS